jgi:hypothetical protein
MTFGDAVRGAVYCAATLVASLAQKTSVRPRRTNCAAALACDGELPYSRR